VAGGRLATGCRCPDAPNTPRHRFGHDEPEPDERFAEVTHDLAREVATAVGLLVRRIESGSGNDPPEERRRLFPYAFRHGGTFPAAEKIPRPST
jgi:hypothetical protein